MFFGCSLPSGSLLKCISMTNQECKLRPKIGNFSSDERVFYSFNIKKQVNAVVVVIMSKIHKQKYVSPMF